MTVRVLRFMEYTYPDAESAFDDMEHWAVHGARSFRSGCVIKSTTLSPSIIDDEIEVAS